MLSLIIFSLQRIGIYRLDCRRQGFCASFLRRQSNCSLSKTGKAFWKSTSGRFQGAFQAEDRAKGSTPDYLFLFRHCCFQGLLHLPKSVCHAKLESPETGAFSLKYFSVFSLTTHKSETVNCKVLSLIFTFDFQNTQINVGWNLDCLQGQERCWKHVVQLGTQEISKSEKE